MDTLKANREFLKADLWEEWSKSQTDQQKKLPAPPLEKPIPVDAKLIDLPAPENLSLGQMPLAQAIRQRQSRRKYTQTPFDLSELSFLLWACQGVREVLASGKTALRTVPSGGARHPCETYLAINSVQNVEPGLYRYLPLEHKLLFLRTESDLADKVDEACSYQGFIRHSAVTFIWTAIPYRSEWRYSIVAAKLIALDAGHICQNLYLACEAIGAGVCAVAAYDQKKMDALLQVDGEDEFALYVAPVGKLT